MATKKFVCNVCGYIHEGDAAPESCPVCKAPASEFTEVKKKGLFSDKNGNPYIIMYATVMVVIVAALLAVASLSLQKRQYANELNEKKQSILQSLFAAEAAAEGITAAEYIAQKGVDYDSFIVGKVLDAEGNPLLDEEGNPVKDEVVFNLLKDLNGAFADGKFPVFEAADGRVVVPVTGAGLWGPIWGYVALDKDMNTMAGIIMAHKGETPGLGAEIATPKYQSYFVGKKIFEGDEFVSIKLRKGGATEANIEHEVDAISGGTKTSDGVTSMLYNSLSNYLPFLESRRAAAPVNDTAETTVPSVEEVAAPGDGAVVPGSERSVVTPTASVPENGTVAPAANGVSNEVNRENNE